MLVYYNTLLTLAIGAQDVYSDIQLDEVSGYVYEVKELDLLFNAAGDTGNTHHDIWLSVMKDGRSTWVPFSDHFATDILGQLVNVKSDRAVGSFPLETPEQGYLADNPYFAHTVRLGLSTDNNVAGSPVTLAARLTAERIKSTTEIVNEMYRRANT